MRSNSFAVTSVRTDKGIVHMEEKLRRVSWFWKLPFIRGITNLLDMLVVGMRSLIWSANQNDEEEEESLTNQHIFWLIATSFLFATLIFVIAPFYLTKLMVPTPGIKFNIVDGLVRVLFFVLYVYTISFLEDVRILYQYHGAEHKAVHCFEAGKKLTLANVKKYTTLHGRCGTAFIGIVLMVSIFVFSFIKADAWYYRLGARFILIPFIASISYELLKLGDRFKKNYLLKLMILPGLWLQKITTREPNNKQILVAIDALKKVLNLEAKESTK